MYLFTGAVHVSCKYIKSVIVILTSILFSLHVYKTSICLPFPSGRFEVASWADAEGGEGAGGQDPP